MVFLALVIASSGCAKKYKRPPRTPGTATAASATSPATRPVLEFEKFFAEIDPPADWRYEVTSLSDRHEHVTWIGPGNNTACGILYFRLPWPVGTELAFRYGFLEEMRRKEGVATVLFKQWDDEKECLRFTVDSKQFHTEGNFFVRGWEGWMIYAGTRLGEPVNEAEFETARRVREAAEFVESK